MRLRCDGICNDQFITQSLLRLRVKKFWKLVNICRSYGQLNRGSFLWNTAYISTDDDDDDDDMQLLWFTTHNSKVLHIFHNIPVVKIQDTLHLLMTSPTVDWFSRFFHHQTQKYMHNEIIIKDPMTSKATLPREN